METFVLRCLEIGLVPGLFVVLLVYLLKDKEHLRIRLEAREDELMAAYKANVRVIERLTNLWGKRECLAGEDPQGGAT
jgi:hypothetical protein